MSLRASLELFIVRPKSAAVLALLCIVLGFVSVSDIVPLSANRQYFPGHEWILASLSWMLAIFFGYCALKGFSKLRPNKK